MSNLETVLREKYGREVVTAEELAVELGVKEEEVMEEIKNNNLKSRKIGKKTLITIKEIARLFGENESNDTQYQEMLDQMATPTLTCQQVIEDENIEVVECDVDMSKGCVTCVKGDNGKDRWMLQIDLGKTPAGKRIRKSKSYKTEAEAREALKCEIEKLGGVETINKQNESTVPKQSTEKNLSKLNFTESVNKFLEHLETEKQLNSRTMKSYRDDLKPIVERLGEKNISEVTSNDIRELFYGKDFSNYTKGVISKKWFRCKALFKWAYKNKFINENIFNELEESRPRNRDKSKSNKDRILKDETIVLIKQLAQEDEKFKILTYIIHRF